MYDTKTWRNNAGRKPHQLGVADVIQTITLTKDFSGTHNSHLSQLPVFEPGTPPRAAQVAMATEDGKDVEYAAMMLDSMVKCGQRNITVACHSEDMSLAAAARPLRKLANSGRFIYAATRQNMNRLMTGEQ